MNLSCGVCDRILAMPHITDLAVAWETGSSSGWAIDADVLWCPACATALWANSLDAAGSPA